MATVTSPLTGPAACPGTRRAPAPRPAAPTPPGTSPPAARVWGAGAGPGARRGTGPAAGPLNGEVTVAMGEVRELGESTATVAGWGYRGIGIDVGNPHLACVDPELTADALAKLDLTVAPGYDPDLFPQGVNIELVTALDVTGAVDMRVYERGVGETRSCGTGPGAARGRCPGRGWFPDRRGHRRGDRPGPRRRSLRRTRARPCPAARPIGAGGDRPDRRRVVAGPVTGPRPRISTCAVLGFRGSMDGV